MTQFSVTVALPPTTVLLLMVFPLTVLFVGVASEIRLVVPVPVLVFPDTVLLLKVSVVGDTVFEIPVKVPELVTEFEDTVLLFIVRVVDELVFVIPVNAPEPDAA